MVWSLYGVFQNQWPRYVTILPSRQGQQRQYPTLRSYYTTFAPKADIDQLPYLCLTSEESYSPATMTSNLMVMVMLRSSRFLSFNLYFFGTLGGRLHHCLAGATSVTVWDWPHALPSTISSRSNSHSAVASGINQACVYTYYTPWFSLRAYKACLSFLSAGGHVLCWEFSLSRVHWRLPLQRWSLVLS